MVKQETAAAVGKARARQPIRHLRHALQKDGRIAHQSAYERNIPQKRRNMAGGRGENGFREQERAGGGRGFQHFLEKAVRVLNATRLQADDQTQPRRAGGIG